MDTAMRAGAMGMTTALIYPPSSSTRRPTSWSRWRRSAAKYGGVYASHIRGEGAEVVQSVREVIAIWRARRAAGRDLPSQGGAQAGLGHADGLRAAGRRSGARARRRRRGGHVRLHRGRHRASRRRSRAGRTKAADDSLRARLANPGDPRAPQARDRDRLPGWWNIIEAAGGWDGVVLVNARNPANAKYRARSIAQIAREMGKDPADAALDLVVAGQGRVMAIYHMMSEPDIETALQVPVDEHRQRRRRGAQGRRPDPTGLPHPRCVSATRCASSRSTCSERQVLTLEEAMRKMTSWPATRMRLRIAA